MDNNFNSSFEEKQAIIDIFIEILLNSKDKNTLINGKILLRKMKSLSKENLNIVINNIEVIINQMIMEQDVEKCLRDGHEYGEWKQYSTINYIRFPVLGVELTKFISEHPDNVFYSNGNYYFKQECINYKRVCQICGNEEIVNKISTQSKNNH